MVGSRIFFHYIWILKLQNFSFLVLELSFQYRFGHFIYETVTPPSSIIVGAESVEEAKEEHESVELELNSVSGGDGDTVHGVTNEVPRLLIGIG